MDIFKKSDFTDLSDIHHSHCVSIYIPTNRAGQDEGAYKNKIHFKNQVKEAQSQLQGFGLSKEESENYLSKANQLVDDENFWTDQSDGLAVFIYEDNLVFHKLPIPFEPFTYISNHLYLKPLAGLLNGEGRHFIMALSLGDVRFFEANQYSVTPVITEGLIPEELTEAVGKQFEERSLQFRTGRGEGGEGAMYHGHGSGADTEKKEEALQYFQAIDKGLMKMLHDETAPMVIACVDYLFPIYKEANTYNQLQEQHISGNHEATDAIKLKELSWNIVKDEFNMQLSESENHYNNLLNDGKASFNPEEAIPAAIIGQAEILFINRDKQIWGTYNPDNNKVSFDDVQTVGNAELLNKAAIETVKHGGTVYVMDGENMPEKDSDVNAVFRYPM